MKLIKGEIYPIIGIDFCGQDRLGHGKFIGIGRYEGEQTEYQVLAFEAVPTCDDETFNFYGCVFETTYYSMSDEFETYLRAKYIGSSLENLRIFYMRRRNPTFILNK